MKKHRLDAWGDIPIFMTSGGIGVAIFPIKTPVIKKQALNEIRIDHFAFTVSKSDFEMAQAYFKSIGEAFKFQNHHYFHSIYLRDPDGHKVELTTLVLTENPLG